MLQKMLSKEEVNTGRQKEIDLVKAFTILMMVVCHCIEELYDYAGDPVATIIREYENQVFGAQAFMIAMGIGIAYSKRSDAKSHLKRGVSLLMTGQVLNLARYAVPVLIGYSVTGDIFWRKTAFLVFSSDIMQFAGLAFLLIGVLQLLRLSEIRIFLAAVVLNGIGTLTALKVKTGSYAVDQLLGLFLATETESYFPLFHWFIFPAFGMLFGKLLRHAADKKRFYLSLLAPAGLLTLLYFYVAKNIDQPVFRALQDLNSLCSMNTADALMQLACNTFLICLCFLIVKHIGERGMKGVGFLSGNINRFYCVQWVCIGFVKLVFLLASVDVDSGNWYVCYLTAAAVIAVTCAATALYSGRFAEKWTAWFGKRKALWYAVVITLSLIVCVWAYGAGLPLPNYLNDYLY